jgi:hypothetical protein
MFLQNALFLRLYMVWKYSLIIDNYTWHLQVYQILKQKYHIYCLYKHIVAHMSILYVKDRVKKFDDKFPC